MSLLTDAFTECRFLNKTKRPDGEGGYVNSWTAGEHFHAAITFDSSIEARTAEKSGVTSLYTVTAKKGVQLDYHDVFERLSDHKTFRITSDGGDKQTPDSASFQVQQVTAEEWTVV